MAEAVSVTGLGADPGEDLALWLALRQLCCRTGNGGEPIPPERWPLFGDIWVAPYQRLIPQWSYVALAEGTVVGYLTGCPDSESFSRRRFLYSTLPLLWQVAFGRFRADDYGRRYVRQALGLERSVERCFPRSLRRDLRQRFPAHLHMNVGADHRGSGIGKRLLERFINDLRHRQISGVHLFCGGVPVAFYTRMGFRELAVVQLHGSPVYAMGFVVALPARLP